MEEELELLKLNLELVGLLKAAQNKLCNSCQIRLIKKLLEATETELAVIKQEHEDGILGGDKDKFSDEESKILDTFSKLFGNKREEKE